MLSLYAQTRIHTCAKGNIPENERERNGGSNKAVSYTHLDVYKRQPEVFPFLRESPCIYMYIGNDRCV